MQALLVNPWIYDFAAYDLFSKPIGFLQIATCLKRLGVKVSLTDCLDRLHPRLIDFLEKKAGKSLPSGCGNYYSEPAEKPAVYKDIPRQYKRYGLPPLLFKEILKELKIKNFAFYDDALFYNPENHIIKTLQLILQKRISANFYTPNGLHARFLNKGLASLLKKTNFIQPRLGFETASLSRQRQSGGKVNNRDLTMAVSYLKEAGYRPQEIGVYLMIGLPGQSFEEIEASLYFVHRLKVRVYLEEYSPVPGSPDYEASGLPKDADPLLHNNSAFPLYSLKQYKEFQKLKDLNHRLNGEL